MATSSPWTQLPHEIQKNIFIHLRDRDFLQLQKSCRSWRLAAMELYYTHLSIAWHFSEKRQSQLIEALGHPENPARHFVKELMVEEQWVYEKASGNDSILTALGSLCPNLTVIESNKPTREFYKRLLDLRQAGHLLKVQHISAPNHSHTSNYYKTMMAFKDTLVELLVNRDLTIDLPQTGSIKAAFKIADYLGEFKCLKRLHIDLAQDVALHRIEELLALCSSSSMLETVKVTMAIKKKEEEDKTFDNDCYINVQELPRLLGVKQFTLINRWYLSTQDMVYIMHKFPGLKQLHSSTEGHYSEEPKAERYTTEVVQQFSRYISKLDRCHICLFKAAPALILDAITQLSKGFKADNMTVYGSDEVDDERCAYLNIMEHPRQCHSIHLILPTLYIEPLHQTALEAFAPQIKKLQLYGTMNPEGARIYTRLFSNVQIATNRILSDSVEFILSKFSLLKKLYLYNLVINTSSSTTGSSTRKQARLDDLYIYQCALNPQTLHQLSQHLEYIERFRLKDVAFWVQGDLTIIDNQRDYRIDMPYTTFGTLFLPDDIRADSIIVKICTDTTTKYFLHRRDQDGTTSNELTKQDYNYTNNLHYNAQSIHVRCRHFTTIDFGRFKLASSD
ncbi:hypothetical protein V8B55DRAFT_1148843 [Mucor lusitanicus]|uniref:F-box domain-containing protein n=1 Tax=Mucor circinelloides f. lusitanicus TaxID=29924 RepID=A0A8H4BBW2_MUCCL|nr:hypothetical protein FB192DRAFT_1386262 [Mucor lusitanicus]